MEIPYSNLRNVVFDSIVGFKNSRID